MIKLDDIHKARNLALVEALESGKYQQTTGQLRDRDGFCCLGVACEIHRLETGEGEWIFPEVEQVGYKPSYLNAFGTVPDTVAEWYGWQNDFGIDSNPDLATSYATDLNDEQGLDFIAIAAEFRKAFNLGLKP